MTLPKINAPVEIADVALEILQKRGEPIKARELCEAILAERGSATETGARALAEIHTAINLDNRFVPMPDYCWGLKEWAPKPKPSRVVARVSDRVIARRKQTDGDLDDDGEATEEEKEWE